MNFTQAMETVTRLFEVLGVGVILVGLLVSAYQAVVLMAKGSAHLAYEKVRSTFGRSVLLGLELLVAGDIIRTVALDPTMDNLLVLGLLVVIRTFLSWSLEVEIDGRWPWQAAALPKDGAKDAQTRP
jgi:uncharacterized membrane protein